MCCYTATPPSLSGVHRGCPINSIDTAKHWSSRRKRFGRRDLTKWMRRKEIGWKRACTQTPPAALKWNTSECTQGFAAGSPLRRTMLTGCRPARPALTQRKNRSVKSETRNPKSETNSKHEIQMTETGTSFKATGRRECTSSRRRQTVEFLQKTRSGDRSYGTS